MTDKLANLVARRHPEYEASLTQWSFLDACYKGGREWFKGNIFRYMKEGDTEFKDRLARAYRFNHTKEVVDLIDKYLFKVTISRNSADASPGLVRFWGKATKCGLDIDQFSKQVSRKASIFGSVWVAVDSSKEIPDSIAVSVAEAESAPGGVYAYTINPDRVLDFAYDSEGELSWILIYEQKRDDEDPFESSGLMIDQYRLWTKQECTLYSVENSGDGKELKVVQIGDPINHNLGIVPIFRVDNQITDEKWKAASLIGDIAYLDRAVANYLSNLDAIIQDQTFSQLAMPAQGLMPGEEGYDKVVEMGTKRVFLYDGSGGEPKFLSPDPKQAAVILSVISKIINEIYHTVGMAGERTKQDNAVGIDNSSGVAKAFDFERVNALLVSKAASLELAERRLIKLASLWSGEEDNAAEFVAYSRSFDVRGLADEFFISSQLTLIEAPDTVRREQMRTVISKIFPIIDSQTIADITNELKTWPPQAETVLPTRTMITG